MPDFDSQHRNNLLEYQRKQEALYIDFAKKIAKIANDPKAKFQKAFKFSNNKEIQKKVDELSQQFNSELYSLIELGIKKEWALANTKNDALVSSIIKSAEILNIDTGLTNHNISALKAFIARSEDGMNLSDRIWNLTKKYQQELENHLKIGIVNGDSADVISKRIRQYLDEPEKLFRRVRTPDGKLVLSKAAREYHPGQGVYRSSYKNARRLASTETNMSYRNSDHERWMKNPAIVGFEVKISNNHPVDDICDSLKGKYPKNFKFSGWHPHCRCYAVPIRLKDNEFDDYLDSILEGKEYDPTTSENYVSSVPEGFKNWVAANEARLANMKNPPYFIRDNFKGKDLLKNLKVAKTQVLSDNVEKSDWERNLDDVAAKIGGTKGEEMTFEDANELKGNENFLDGGYEYKVNCQSCVVANELRRRGFDVSANPNFRKEGSITRKLSYQTNMAWITQETKLMPLKSKAGGFGKLPNSSEYKTKTLRQLEIELDDLTKEQGRYHIDFVWKGGRSGHIITLERLENNKLRFYDPQSGKIIMWSDLKQRIGLSHGVNVLRVDNLLVNTEIIDGIVYLRTSPS